MSAGTITLTNGSAIVGGTGTSFATELAAGDFIVSTVGGVPYTLPVKTVDSNTQLTLVSNYTGPTQSGAAWSAVPRVALNMVTAALVAQSAEALRGLNYDKQNWQRIFSGTGNVTVTLPDGTTWTGPAWNSITESLSGKAAKGANSDITSLSALTTALSVEQGGTGSTTESGARTNLGLGNLAVMNSNNVTENLAVLPGKQITVKSAGPAVSNDIALLNKNYTPNPATYASWMRANSGSGFVEFGPTRSGLGNLYSCILTVKADANSNASAFTFWPDGNADATNWRNSSDPRLKNLIGIIENPLEKMELMRGYTWTFKKHNTFGIGFLSSEVKKAFPEAVVKNDLIEETLPDGTVVKSPETVDVIGVAAGLHHEAILALMVQVEDLKKKLDALRPGS
ncbi:tail fiber domain-containing protein [Enterobacter roggenkampii]|uniref:tail fiber domain-containing protein n=1 Tax=Enterobacter roggenkampii TaxID=1812935 RepID=UPI000F8432AB|nr:tail fiber domain-containing protein [Enterobacter roggenkampii]EKY3999493.1 tail fiber domain-containing protein [Enterobacter roggenkampii]RTM94614.1 tail fiber domain-containing protein [Enterobacter roggenkampii]